MQYGEIQFNKPSYAFDYVSGGNDIQPENYIEEQKKNIRKKPSYNKKNESKIVPTIFPFTVQKNNDLEKTCETNERYDMYKSYLEKHGLDKYCESKNKYTLHYLNVDSSLRNKIPRNIKNETEYLPFNPILLQFGTNTVYIKHKNHNYQIGDKIALSGIKKITDKLNVYGTIKKDIISSSLWTTTNVSDYIFELYHNSEYMKIKNTHYLNIYYTGLIPQEYYLNYPINDLYVTISGFTGNGTNLLYFDNIPINIINTTHNIILKDPVTGYITRNAFYIKLPYVYKSPTGVFVPPANTFQILITYEYIGGLPIYLLNADYPLDKTRSQGFYVIDSVDQNGYYIKTIKESLGPYDETYSNKTDIYVGGDLINVASIKDTIVGDSYPNSYTVLIEPSYRNVALIRMISSEFPDYGKTITNDNNKLYWQNYIDGEHVYSVSLPTGNYGVADIVNSLQLLIYDTPRINHSVNASYTFHHYIRILVDSVTDIVEFRAYKESLVPYAITGIDPPISSLGSTVQNVILTIYHPNHNLSVGDLLLINGAIDTSGIPASILNAQFTVNTVIDQNYYTIKLPYFNILSSQNNTSGGINIKIYTTDIFKLRFDFSDTVGSIFGFRDVGEFGSITKFGTIIKNTDPYYNEPLYDQNGLEKIITNDRISLSAKNYILVTCNDIEVMKSNGPIKNIFTKILLTNKTGYIYNSYVNTNKIFPILITEISEMKFNFYDLNGNLYDFNNLDHSFTLEIMTLDNDVKETGINTLTGQGV